MRDKLYSEDIAEINPGYTSILLKVNTIMNVQ